MNKSLFNLDFPNIELNVDQTINLESSSEEIISLDINNIIKPSNIFSIDFSNDYPYKKESNNHKGNNSKKKKYFEIKKQIKIPRIFLEDKINNKIKIMNTDKEMEKKFLLDYNSSNDKIVNIKDQLNINYKRRRRKQIKEIIKYTQQGRKKKNDDSSRNHDKYAADNIINKIKTIIDRSLIVFINKLIKSRKINKFIKKINYNFRVNKRKKNDNLEFFNMSIKNYLSHDISTKYSKTKYSTNYNEILINNILEDNKNKNLFDFIFNLKIEDWLNLFIYKNELKDFDKFNSLDKSQMQTIKDNLDRIDKVFEKIYEEDKLYFHLFCLLIFNLRRYWIIKKNRNSIKKEDN